MERKNYYELEKNDCFDPDSYVGFVFSCLWGAGNNSQASASTAEVNLDGDFTVSELRVAIWDNNQRDGLQQIADAWTETSGVKVNVEVIDWGNYWTLLEAGANGGDLPDVFWMHSNTAQMYMENDLLLNLDPYIAADDKIDLSNYYPGIVELFTRSDGAHYAVPKDHDTNALLYNKAIFDAYGVTYPLIIESYLPSGSFQLHATFLHDLP